MKTLMKQIWRRIPKSSNIDVKRYLSTKVDFRSDTVTKPTQAMYEAMVSAPLGDHVMEEDPTAIKLQRRCAELFGKEDALFVPTGTMGNLISVMAHCQSRFQEAIAGDLSHLVLYEVAGCAHIGGVQLRTVTNKSDGTFDINEAEKLIRDSSDVHQPQTALISVENTHNKCGGQALPLTFLQEVQQFARQNDLKFHMDGARLLNAATYLNCQPSEILQYVDSVSMCFSKGLSTPAGSIIAGTKEFINRSKRICKALGGSMRQVGILAAPALVSLDTIYPNLIQDHRKTKEIATVLDNLRSYEVVQVNINSLHTNILMIDLIKNNYTAHMFCERLQMVTEKELSDLGEEISILMFPYGSQRVRMVIHHDINQGLVEKTITKFEYVIKELSKN